MYSIIDYTKYSLREASSLISKDILSMREECVKNIERLQRRLDEITIEYREAAAQGDLRENSAYQEAGDELNNVNRDIVRESDRLMRLDSLDKYESEYVSIGLVIEMCTVKLQVTNATGTYEIVLKVFPKGISYINRNMIAIDAPVIQDLYRKAVGDTATMYHRMTKEKIVYKVLEIY